MAAERIRAELDKLMVAPDPRAGIELLVETGLAAHILPEVPKLKLETDEHHRHKDVYEHSLTVLTQATGLEEQYGLSGDLVVRLAALLHDIGKPKTRTLLPGGRVAFHHHEVVGAAMARSRLRALRFPRAVVENVARLVELHLRFHGYGTGEWTDSAVRRYVRDAGPLLTRLHVLTRADCTTRNKARAARLASAYDALEQRIARLANEEEIARIRPDLDGNEIMRILGVPSGPVVGEAYRFLLGLRMRARSTRSRSELRPNCSTGPASRASHRRAPPRPPDLRHLRARPARAPARPCTTRATRPCTTRATRPWGRSRTADLGRLSRHMGGGERDSGDNWPP